MKALNLLSSRAAIVPRHVSGVFAVQHFYAMALILVPLFGASAAKAGPFVIASGSTTVLDGYTESISGTFSFNSMTDIESAVSITLSGLAPFSGTYVLAGSSSTISAMDIHADDGLTGLALHFSDPLDGSLDPITSVAVSSIFPPSVTSIPVPRVLQNQRSLSPARSVSW